LSDQEFAYKKALEELKNMVKTKYVQHVDSLSNIVSSYVYFFEEGLSTAKEMEKTLQKLKKQPINVTARKAPSPPLPPPKRNFGLTKKPQLRPIPMEKVMGTTMISPKRSGHFKPKPPPKGNPLFKVPKWWNVLHTFALLTIVIIVGILLLK